MRLLKLLVWPQEVVELGRDQGQNEKKKFNENYYFSGANRVTKYLNGSIDFLIKMNEIFPAQQ